MKDTDEVAAGEKLEEEPKGIIEGAIKGDMAATERGANNLPQGVNRGP